MTNNCLQTIKNNSLSTQDTLTLYMNYLAVVYAFFLPISWQARSTIFVMILFLFLLRRNYIYYLRLSFSNPITKAFLLYLSIYFIWLIGTENFQHATKMIKLAEYAIIPFVFLTFLTKDFGYKVLAAFIGSVFLSELLSYLIRFEFLPVKLNLFSFTIYEAVAVLDPTPYLLHMHYTVTLSTVIAILFLQLFSDQQSFKIKFFSILFILTATINLTLVQGRSGYLTYVILLITVVVIKFKRKAFIPLLGILFFILIVAHNAYNHNPAFQQRIDEATNTIKTMYHNPTDFSSSFGTRVGLWYYGIEATKDNLWFGLGTGDQMDAVGALVPEKHIHLKTMHHLHNQYIEMFTQFGIIGLLVFLNIFYQIFKYKQAEQNNKEIMIIVAVGIIFALMTETFSAIYYLPMFATLISASIANNQFLTNKITQKKEQDFMAYAGITAIALLAVYVQ